MTLSNLANIACSRMLSLVLRPPRRTFETSDGVQFTRSENTCISIILYSNVTLSRERGGIYSQSVFTNRGRRAVAMGSSGKGVRGMTSLITCGGAIPLRG